MRVNFAKWDIYTLHIQTGSCSLGDWAEQETTALEAVVQTAVPYHPEDLFLDDDFVLRAHGRSEDPDDPGEPVAVAQPLTRLWMLRVVAAVNYGDHPRQPRDYVLQHLPFVASRDEARALCVHARIALDWASFEAGT